MTRVNIETRTQPAACCAPLRTRHIAEDQAATLAAVFKALADPARVRIVNLLANSREPVCVCDLTAQLDLAQPTVSFHLKKLLLAGLVHREQRGTWAHYSLDHAALARVAGVLQPEGAKR